MGIFFFSGLQFLKVSTRSNSIKYIFIIILPLPSLFFYGNSTTTFYASLPKIRVQRMEFLFETQKETIFSCSMRVMTPPAFLSVVYSNESRVCSQPSSHIHTSTNTFSHPKAKNTHLTAQHTKHFHFAW